MSDSTVTLMHTDCKSMITSSTLTSILFYIQTKVLMNVSIIGIDEETFMETVAQMERTSFNANPGMHT